MGPELSYLISNRTTTQRTPASEAAQRWSSRAAVAVAMLRAASRASLVARKNALAARRYSAEPFDAARAAHELEVARLKLEEKKLDQGRGAWEVLFGVKRETAQMLNLCMAGGVFISSGLYLVTSQLLESKAALQAVTHTRVKKQQEASLGGAHRDRRRPELDHGERNDRRR